MTCAVRALGPFMVVGFVLIGTFAIIGNPYVHAEQPVITENRVENGSFEMVEEGGEPSNWIVSVNTRDAVEFQTDDMIARSGEKSLRILTEDRTARGSLLQE